MRNLRELLRDEGVDVTAPYVAGARVVVAGVREVKEEVKRQYGANDPDARYRRLKWGLILAAVQGALM